MESEFHINWNKMEAFKWAWIAHYIVMDRWNRMRILYLGSAIFAHWIFILYWSFKSPQDSVIITLGFNPHLVLTC